AWYSLLIGVAMIWIAAILGCRGTRVAGDLFEPFGRFSGVHKNIRHGLVAISFLLLGISTLTLIYSQVILRFCSHASQLAWLTESYFFSGVTLQLPLVCATAAGVAMCYMKMRQSFLVSNIETKEAGAILRQERSYETLWFGLGENVPRSPAVPSETATQSGNNPLPTEKTQSLPMLICWLVLCIGGPIWCLSLIFSTTIVTSATPALFRLTWLIIAFGYVLWWLAALELLVLQRQLRNRAKDLMKKPPSAEVQKAFGELNKLGYRGVYRMLFGPKPSEYDAFANYASDGNSEIAAALFAFREIHYRFVIVKNQIYLLILGAILLFCAIVSYPFTSEITLCSLATITILSFVCGASICFWRMEHDKYLSDLLGTTANEMEWDLRNISVFVSYGLIAVLVLVSQFVPGSWMTLGRALGPLMHLGQ
ncbi:MAG: hypothetical protein JWM11_3469, partial [Planctomycetaceae bacterium]|nr:hypothetical protein [Planctomycetaceae bacterium]